MAPLSLKPVVPFSARKVDVGGEARRLAEHHIARAEVSRSHRPRRADDQVGVAVAVHVARRRHRDAGEGRRRPRRSAGSRCCRSGVDRSRLAGEARRLAEHDVAGAGRGSRSASAHQAPTIRSSKPSPFTSPAEATENAALGAGRRAAQLEAGARRSASRRRRWRQSPTPCRTPCSSRRRCCRSGRRTSADDEVVEAVAVHVARRRDRPAGTRRRPRAAQPEAGGAVERRQVDVGGKACPPCRTPHSSRRSRRAVRGAA